MAKKSKPAPTRAKASTAKQAAKHPAKPAAKPAKAPVSHAKKPAPAPAKSAPAKVAPKNAPAKTPAPEVKGPALPPPGGPDRAKPKGITIVSQKPMRRPKIKKPLVMPDLGAPLLKPGAKRPKPLIASGPNAPSTNGLDSSLRDPSKFKTHLSKKELDRYRDILLRKRAELVGDVRGMEGEALQGSSGSLSHTPQHMADQGSDAYDQALSLDLAQVDRNLIKEIDDALARIAAGTFGVCEITGKPINTVRLDELPWTRFSIEGARERERRVSRSI